MTHQPDRNAQAALVRAAASFVRDTYSGEWADDAAATLETDAALIEQGEPCSLLRLAEAMQPAAVSAAVAPPTDRAAASREAEAELYVLLQKAGEPRDEAQALIDRHRDEVLRRAELRRMADETATEHRPAVSRWRVETLDNLAGEWAPGTGWPVRALAVERFDAMNAQAPRWKDGTPVTRRLVRETTTYTVEAETGPDAGARQDEPPTPSLRDQHRAAWHALTPDQQTARIAELDEPAAGARQDGAET